MKAVLLHRIRRRYDVISMDCHVGDLKIAFHRITDPDVVLDQIAEEQDLLERLNGTRTNGDQLHLPYWAEMWESSLAIGQYLSRHKCSHKDMSVIDLGCGMGLAGTVAARLGMRVLFADLEAPALLFARLNSLPDAPRVRTRQLNWQTDKLTERFDLILGADILYERKQWEFLEPFWRSHLSPGGVVLLGEPGRQTGDAFGDWIKARGWSVELHSEKVATREKPIRVFVLAQN